MWNNVALLMMLASNTLASPAGSLFLIHEPSPLVSASGGAYTGVKGGVESLSHNPAGIAGLEVPQISISRYNGSDTWTHDWLAFALPIHGIALNGSALLSKINPIDDYDWSGNKVGEIKVNSNVFSLGIGYVLLDNLGLGINTSYFTSRVDKYNNSGWKGDLGLMYTPIKSFLTLGVSVQNMGRQTPYIHKEIPLPFGYRFGFNLVGYDDDMVKLEFRGDYNYFPDVASMPNLEVGTNLQFIDSISISCGFRNNNLENDYSVGGSYSWRHLMVSYAFLPNNVLGSSHSMSLKISDIAMQKPKETQKETEEERYIRFLKEILIIEPNNLDALMGLRDKYIELGDKENVYEYSKRISDLINSK